MAQGKVVNVKAGEALGKLEPGVTYVFPDFIGMADRMGYEAAEAAGAKFADLGPDAPADLAATLGAHPRAQASLAHRWGMGWIRYTMTRMEGN